MTSTTVLTVAYDGAPFAGFQRQPGIETVQGRLESALSTALRRPVETVCAGRTDTGVHALGQVVSFSAEDTDPPAPDLRRSLNALAGPGVVVRDVCSAPAGFSARHDAVSREYRYRIVPGPVPPLFLRDVAWWVKGPLDTEAMTAAAAHLVGRHDFASFCVAESAARVTAETIVGTVRDIEALEILSSEELGERHLVVRIVGRSFLHSMVRIVVGSLVEVGRGRRDAAWMRVAVEARDRAAAGQTAPPHGLTLWDVRYPEGLLR